MLSIIQLVYPHGRDAENVRAQIRTVAQLLDSEEFTAMLQKQVWAPPLTYSNFTDLYYV